MRAAILWIHVLAGAAWVAGSAASVLAGLALGGEAEQESFAIRSAPRIHAFNLAAAFALLITGIINLVLAGIGRNFRFSGQFGLILAAKVVLFVGMLVALRFGQRLTASVRDVDTAGVARIMNRLVQIDGVIATMGAIALLLGLWLVGA